MHLRIYARSGSGDKSFRTALPVQTVLRIYSHNCRQKCHNKNVHTFLSSNQCLQHIPTSIPLEPRVRLASAKVRRQRPCEGLRCSRSESFRTALRSWCTFTAWVRLPEWRLNMAARNVYQDHDFVLTHVVFCRGTPCHPHVT